MRNRHVLNIATCARVYFGKPLSLNSLHQEMPLESLLHREKAIHQFFAEMLPSSLGPSSSQIV